MVVMVVMMMVAEVTPERTNDDVVMMMVVMAIENLRHLHFVFRLLGLLRRLGVVGP